MYGGVGWIEEVVVCVLFVEFLCGYSEWGDDLGGYEGVEYEWVGYVFGKYGC